MEPFLDSMSLLIRETCSGPEGPSMLEYGTTGLKKIPLQAFSHRLRQRKPPPAKLTADKQVGGAPASP